MGEDYILSYPDPLQLRSEPVVVNVTLLNDVVEGEGLEDIELTLEQDTAFSPLEDSRVLIHPTVSITFKDVCEC